MFIFGATDKDGKYAMLSLSIILIASFIFLIAADNKTQLFSILAITFAAMAYVSRWLVEIRTKVQFRTDLAKRQFLPDSRGSFIVYGAFYASQAIVFFGPTCLLAYSASYEEISIKDALLLLFGYILGAGGVFTIVYYITLSIMRKGVE